MKPLYTKNAKKYMCQKDYFLLSIGQNCGHLGGNLLYYTEWYFFWHRQLSKRGGIMKFTFENLPTSLAEFKAMAQYDLTTAQFTAAAFLLSLLVYRDNRELGLTLIDYLRGPQPLSNRDKQFLNNRLVDKPYLAASYFAGADKANNYTPTELTIEILENDTSFSEVGYAKFYIKSAGADSARPITVRQKGDDYFLWEYSSILLSIIRPAAQDTWA